MPMPCAGLSRRAWDCAEQSACKRTLGYGRLASLPGDKRSQMLCLKADGELALVAGSNALPLAELVRYRDSEYSMDSAMIRQLVDSATTADSRYTPSNARREARKLDTQGLV